MSDLNEIENNFNTRCTIIRMELAQIKKRIDKLCNKKIEAKIKEDIFNREISSKNNHDIISL